MKTSKIGESGFRGSIAAEQVDWLPAAWHF
jgi:hypothetical protein